MAFIIWKIPALQVHPMKIIFWIMIFDSVTIWTEASYNEICSKQAYKLFAWTVFFQNNIRGQTRSVLILISSKFGIVSATYNASVILNISLCWDLIIMIQKPLSSKESRTKHYLFIAFIVASLSFALRLLVVNILYGILLSIYFLSAFFSVIYFWHKFDNTKLGADARSLVLKRHIAYISYYILVNVYVFWMFIYNLKFEFQINQQNTFVSRTFKILYFM